jgi:two-component system, cell cycle sensor histidine kinase and response regulator CckA
MPGMSGVELQKHAAELQPGIKVLFTSGYTDEHLGRNAAAGEHHYLPKPYSVQELTDSVRIVLDA